MNVSLRPRLLRTCALLLVPAFLAAPARADLADKLGRYVGYTILASKTVVGYRNKDGKQSNSFEGCDFGRTILFDDGTALTCAGFGYSYAYRPTAVILVKNSGSFQGHTLASVVMIVEGEEYDMESLVLQ
jgi:hypothetical protein